MPPINDSYKSMSEDAPSLLRPFKIRKVTFKNRIVLSPMCQYSGNDGFLSQWHFAHLGQYAIQGVGLVMVEATAVQEIGRITPDCLGIWKDEHVSKFKELTEFIASQGAKSGIQLAHAGRKAGCNSPFLNQGHDQVATAENRGWPDNIIGPSAIKGWPNAGDPREAKIYDIMNVIHAFGDAARRAYLAGFDVIEIHAAHGYLLHSFLSPLSNKRDDEYGGSFSNRIRLLLEVVERVRMNWDKDLPLFVRLSCEDLAPGGWTINETVELANLLKIMDVDLIDCSSGGLVPTQKIISVPLTLDCKPVEGWNAKYSLAVRETGILTGAVGGIQTPDYAQSLLDSDSASMIFIGRELLRNPSWVRQAGLHFGVNMQYPTQYNRSKPIHGSKGIQ